MAQFLISYKKTSKIEGGYTDEHDDKGNWTGGAIGVGLLIGTNFGISAPVLAKFLGRTPSVSDMKNLSEEIVLAIYKQNYWDKMRGDEIINQDIADSIYDSCVNMGCPEAIKLAQKAAKLKDTGKMDDITLNRINHVK